MRVLVTGGRGFVGRAVVASLSRDGDEVVALTREMADIRDAARLCEVVADARPQAVCHLAALTSARDSFARPVDYFEVNTSGTVNLLRAIEAMRAPRPVKVVFASTSAVYGSGRTGDLGEDDPVNPESPYAASKLANPGRAREVLGWKAERSSLDRIIRDAWNARH